MKANKPVPYDLKVDGISQSALKTFMSCRRKWMLNIAGLSRPGIQINTHFGTIVHEMLDQVYQNLHELDLNDLDDFVLQKLEEYLSENADEISITREQNELEKAMALAMVPMYFQFFNKDKEEFTKIYPEYEFSHPYKNVTLRGKVDGVVEWQGNLWQMEHKTKSRIDEDGLLKSLAFDFQNLMYSKVLDREYAQEGGMKGVLYNVIRKPSIRQTKNESAKEFIERLKKDVEERPDWYFMRYEVVYSKKDKRRFGLQLDGALDEISRFIDGDLPDLQNSAHCLFPFKCEFLDCCALGTTQGLEMRSSMHPELEADTSPRSEILKRYNLKI